MTPPMVPVSMVGFRSGGIRFAIEAANVEAMLPSSRGASSFASLMDLAPAPDAALRVLSVRMGETSRPLTVEEPVATIELDGEAVRPLPALMAARIRIPHIRALTWDDQGLVILLATTTVPPHRPDASAVESRSNDS